LVTQVCVVDAEAISSPSSDATELVGWEWVSTESVDERVRAGDLTNATLLAAWCLYRTTASA
jgi:hypothetical protein